MRATTGLGIPILVLSLALTGCVPDPAAADCERFDAVLAAYDAADARVPEPAASGEPEANVPLFDGYSALGEETAAAASDVLPQIEGQESAELVEAVISAAETLERTSQDAIALVQAGDDPGRYGPEAQPGFVALGLTNAIGTVRLHPCHY